MKQNANVRNK